MSPAVNLGEPQSEQAVNGPAVPGSFQQVGVWSCGWLAILSSRGCWDNVEPSLGDQFQPPLTLQLFFFFFFRALSGSGQERKQQSGVTPASLSSVLKLGVLRA